MCVVCNKCDAECVLNFETGRGWKGGNSMAIKSIMSITIIIMAVVWHRTQRHIQMAKQTPAMTSTSMTMMKCFPFFLWMCVCCLYANEKSAHQFINERQIEYGACACAFVNKIRMANGRLHCLSFTDIRSGAHTSTFTPHFIYQFVNRESFWFPFENAYFHSIHILKGRKFVVSFRIFVWMGMENAVKIIHSPFVGRSRAFVCRLACACWWWKSIRAIFN